MSNVLNIQELNKLLGLSHQTHEQCRAHITRILDATTAVLHMCKSCNGRGEIDHNHPITDIRLKSPTPCAHCSPLRRLVERCSS